MRYLKSFVSALMGGACIGLGGIAFLTLENKVLGALFFTVGLFTICTFHLNLFTGKVCYVFQRDRAYARELPLIWLGNLAGTGLVAAVVRLSRLAPLSEKAAAICQVKLSDTLVSLFLLSLLCNIFIYIAVESFQKNPHELGKYLSLFFGVMGFVLCGFEHCVANMFYFSVSGAWSGEALVRLLVMTLGNSAGGVLFPLVRQWLKNENT